MHRREREVEKKEEKGGVRKKKDFEVEDES